MCECPKEFLVNRQLCAEFHGITPKTIIEWAKDGLPVHTIRKGKNGNIYCLRCVSEWRTEYLLDSGTIDLTAERARLAKEQADKLQRERLKEEGKLLETDAVLEWVKRGDQKVRSKVLSIPSRCAPLLIGQTKVAAVESILKDTVYEALRELADTSDLQQCSKGGNP